MDDATPNPQNERTIIKYVDIFGDSLSDRGTLYKRKLFGFISLNFFSGLQGRSPQGSFTNGFIWTDHFIAMLANKLTVRKMRKRWQWLNEDIADAFIANDPKVSGLAQSIYDLKDDEKADYRGRRFVRTYTEGGLTSRNYHWIFSWNPIRFITRLLMSFLGQKRRDLFNDDERRAITPEQKEQTLVLEWSGANDMVTVNKVPNKKIVDKAIASRIEHVEEMIKSGYRHFMLFNLPDIALTPRYKTSKRADAPTVTRFSQYFNDELRIQCERLQEKYPYCHIDVYDINSKFSNIYQDPKKYGIDPAKIDVPFTESPDYQTPEGGISAADKYLFWDGIHPSSDAQARMADELLTACKDRYKFMAPMDPEVESITRECPF